jgi:hypothetical protein
MKCGRPPNGKLFLDILRLDSLLLRGEDITEFLKRRNVRQRFSATH